MTKTIGRPRLPDDQIKHPRSKYKRKSNHVSQQLDIPEPSAKELARWAPLARLCWERVISNPSSHIASKKNMIDIVWPNAEAIPESFPRGRHSKKVVASGHARRYNAEAVLMWLWERRLTKYSVSELYKLRTEAWLSAVGGLNAANGLLLDVDVSSLLNEIDVDE